MREVTCGGCREVFCPEAHPASDAPVNAFGRLYTCPRCASTGLLPSAAFWQVFLEDRK